MLCHFALRLLFGISLMWAAMPRRQTAHGFFRIQMLVGLGLAILAWLSYPMLREVAPTDRILWPARSGDMLLGVAVLCYLGSVLWTLNRRKSGACTIFAVLFFSALAMFGTLIPTNGADVPRSVLLLATELFTSATLGGAVVAMLLGHWYLTTPTMSLDPLRRMNWLYGGSLGGRLIVSGFVATTSWELLSDTTDFIWLSLRWVAGLIIPLVVVFLVFGTLRYRNTQSATGLLFVGVVLSFIGELMGTLLFWKLGQPF